MLGLEALDRDAEWRNHTVGQAAAGRPGKHILG